MSPTQTQTPLIPTPSVFPAVRSHALANNPNWRYVGAPLHKGPLPAVIYFALSATQSLELDPFNQVVSALLDTAPRDSLRVFSVTLPFHGEDMAQNEKAFERWRSVYEAGGDPVSSMVRRASNVLGQLVDTGYVRKREIVAAGLSRGGLLAALLAVRNDHVRACVEFAPVTVLGDLPEFSNETVQGGKAREMVGRASLLTPTVVNALVRMPVRFYMGNFDRRVGTRNAFELVHLLAERAVLHERVRSPPHEFVMYCRYVSFFLYDGNVREVRNLETDFLVF